MVVEPSGVVAYASGPTGTNGVRPLIIAAGNSAGQVCIWSATTGQLLASLADTGPPVSGKARAQRDADAKAAAGDPAAKIVGLDWVTADPNLVAVLSASGWLTVWDWAAETEVMRTQLPAPSAGLSVDASNRQQLCAWSPSGSFTIAQLRLAGPAAGPPTPRASPRKAALSCEQRTFQAGIGPGQSLACRFTGVPDLLLLVLPRELMLFDRVPRAAKAPLRDALCTLSAGGGPVGQAQTGGVDAVICVHEDDSISSWVRERGAQLMLTCVKLENPLRDAAQLSPVNAAGRGGQVGAAVAAGVWFDAEAEASGALADPGRLRALAVVAASRDGRLWRWRSELPALAADARARDGGLDGPSPRARGPASPLSPGRSALCKPLELCGTSRGIPGKITALAACPAAVELPFARGGREGRGATALVAVGTDGGSVCLLACASCSTGGLPLGLEVVAQLALHPGPVTHLTWLGGTPRLLSASGRDGSGGDAGASPVARSDTRILITDVRSRQSAPLRVAFPDAGPLVGVCASARGAHALLTFRDGPSELWEVRQGAKPARARQIDLPFAAVAWGAEARGAGALPLLDPGRGREGGDAEAAPAAEGSALSVLTTPRPASPASPVAPGTPRDEEKLAFALTDGRVGVLSVCGRRVQDLKPHPPALLALEERDFVVSSMAAWAHYVFLGERDGTLVQWDTVSGRCQSYLLGRGRAVVSLVIGAAPSTRIYPDGDAVLARIVALSAGGVAHVLDLQTSGDLRPVLGTLSSIQNLASGRRSPEGAPGPGADRLAEAAWLALPEPLGAGSALVARRADGDALLVLDALPRPPTQSGAGRGAQYQALLGRTLPRAAPCAALSLLPPMLLRTLASWTLAVGPLCVEEVAMRDDFYLSLLDEGTAAELAAWRGRAGGDEAELLAAVAGEIAAQRALPGPLGPAERGVAEALGARWAAACPGDRGRGAGWRALLALLLGAPASAQFWEAVLIVSEGGWSDGVVREAPLPSLAAHLHACRARSRWHEAMPRDVFESSEALQEKRVLEYVALRDPQAAVGFLLASPPERSVRYYRDALCTLAMAFSVGADADMEDDCVGDEAEAEVEARADSGSGPAAAAPPSRAKLLISQAAKVIAANAASVGDSLLGVPLLCATGQDREAAEILLDAGAWRLALALVARRTQAPLREEVALAAARTLALEEGRLWDAARLLAGGGMPRAARDLLETAGCGGAAHDLGLALGLSTTTSSA
ncbi:hypothetical protein QBZ16_001522 [Prototheca wickerhamii]|uniref:Uncharacterized protein n=1 Tax=Prototheca wickerhamii TaxID=3111 RepID=A0AAD9MLQ9_PROWI|nr:hypothetical protein QBZ16_001522 [Prototheca wickerhamii]